MKHVYLFLISLLSYCISNAQPVIDWRGTYGGSDFETPAAVQITPGGGIILAGTTFSNDGDATGNKGISDILVVKLKADRTVEWRKTFGGTNEDGAHDIQVTSDGGYIIAGYTKSTDRDVSHLKGTTDYWVIKLRADGTIQWQRTYGGTQQDVASSIKPLPGGGYIVAGYTMSNDIDVTNNHFQSLQDAWIVKLDNDGNIIWQRCYGGTDSDFAYHVEIAGNGFIFSGYARSSDGDIIRNNGNMDAWIVKLDATGAIEWQRTMGGAMNETAYDVKPVPAGGFIAVGSTSSASGDVIGNHGTTDVWVIRLAADGSTLWARCYGGTSLEAGRNVTVLPNEKFVITGSAESNDNDVQPLHGRSDYWIVGLNATGNIDWQTNLGGSEIDDAMTACYSTDGKLVIAGTSFSRDHDVNNWKDGGDIWLVQLKFNLPVPVITTQPKDTSVCAGTSASFHIAGTGIDSYQWQVFINNNWVDLTDNAIYDGVKTNALTIASGASTTATQYRCIVANAHGEVISNIAVYRINSTPIITAAPASTTTCTGTLLDLKLSAQFAETYQWQESTNGASWQNIAAATNPVLQVTVTNRSTSYRCTVSNKCKSVVSNAAIITGRNCNIPNAFSPNGDGINDTWQIPFLSDYTDVQVSIYDRYGSKVYETKGRYQPWNGTINSKVLPVGVYYYVINLNNGNTPFSGSLAIIK
jgi:gliding motility-associated-like protein